MTGMRWRQVGCGALGRRQDGFTMVELLVVLAVLGALLVIAVPSYLGYRARSADSAAKSNLRETLPSAEAYYNDKGTYVGMTVPVLRASYDAGIARTVSIAGAPSAGAYCLTDTEGGRSWSVHGPGAAASSYRPNATCS